LARASQQVSSSSGGWQVLAFLQYKASAFDLRAKVSLHAVASQSFLSSQHVVVSFAGVQAAN
jgi:hypothetical protein